MGLEWLERLIPPLPIAYSSPICIYIASEGIKGAGISLGTCSYPSSLSTELPPLFMYSRILLAHSKLLYIYIRTTCQNNPMTLIPNTHVMKDQQ